MKKKFLSSIVAALAVVMGVFAFAGCSSESAPNAGFDIQLAKQVALELDIDVEFVKINWDSKENELSKKKIDLIWNGMTIKDGFDNIFEISTPYMTNKQVAVTKASNASNYTNADSLKTASIAVESGSAGQDAAKAIGVPENKIAPASDQMFALTEVKQDKSQVAIIDLIMANYYINSVQGYEELEILDIDLGEPEYYGIAARKGDKGTIDKINTALSNLYRDGIVQRIAQKYGLESALCDLTYTSDYDNLTDDEKAGWEEIAKNKTIRIGYTVFAPIAYHGDVAA